MLLATIMLFVLIATNGDAYLDLVEIGTVNENFEFMFEDGENLTTVWQGATLSIQVQLMCILVL